MLFNFWLEGSKFFLHRCRLFFGCSGDRLRFVRHYVYFPGAIFSAESITLWLPLAIVDWQPKFHGFVRRFSVPFARASKALSRKIYNGSSGIYFLFCCLSWMLRHYLFWLEFQWLTRWFLLSIGWIVRQVSELLFAPTNGKTTTSVSRTGCFNGRI